MVPFNNLVFVFTFLILCGSVAQHYGLSHSFWSLFYSFFRKVSCGYSQDALLLRGYSLFLTLAETSVSTFVFISTPPTNSNPLFTFLQTAKIQKEIGKGPIVAKKIKRSAMMSKQLHFSPGSNQYYSEHLGT